MNVIVCVDDDMGMLFNHRRQSQDSVLRQRVLDMASGKLWMSEYSAGQFKGAAVWADPNYLDKAEIGDYCFVEREDITPYLPRVERIILYRWNRRYPSDVRFGVDLTALALESTADFVGSSHDKITEEIYTMQPGGATDEKA